MRTRSARFARSIVLALLLTAACMQGGTGTAPGVPPLAVPEDARPVVLRVGYSVANLERVADFYRVALGFEQVEAGELERVPAVPGRSDARSGRFVRLRLGSETIELVQYTPAGRPIPESDSNDLWFQHLAIVVSDMDAAVGKLRKHDVRAVSIGGPQTIPISNPAAGGIRAFYFRDPEEHVLELIWYPAGKGSPRWQARDRLFLGIDHTAIGVSDTERSRAFYEGLLGLRKVGESLNHGPEQASLSGVHGARVEITALAGQAGPGVELLSYLEPGAGRPMPADTRLEDLWHWEIAMRVAQPPRVALRAREQGALWAEPESTTPVFLRDPDGHVIRLVAGRP